MKQKRRPTSDPRGIPTADTRPAVEQLPQTDAAIEPAATRSSRTESGGLSLPPPPQPSRRFTGWAGGLDELEHQQSLAHPPQRAFRTNDGETIFEDQVLVGFVVAPLAAKESLDLYGIDMSYASYDQLNRLWVGCFFSEEVADMLVELTEENEFAHAFEARPSWAELDWKVRQARGETERPEYAVYLYCEAASEEAIEAWKNRTGQDLVRRGAGGDRSEEVTDPGTTTWVAHKNGKK